MSDQPLSDTSAETPEIGALKRKNKLLAQQVKGLIKTEGKLYEYQEKLDAQLKEFKELYQLSKKINATLDIREIFRQAGDYLIRNLSYERVVFLEKFDEGESYAACIFDGYYEPGEEEAIAGLTISRDAPLLSPLRNRFREGSR